MAVTLTDEVKREMIASIKQYFLEERGDEIGDLQATLFLDFVLAEIGPSIYNLGVKNAQAAVQSTVVDLDIALNETEFGYFGVARRRSDKQDR